MPGYTVPHTIVVGETVTVGTMNNEWGGNAAFLANPPSCRVYNSGNISIPDTTETILTFNSERWDTDSMHSTSSSTGRITFTTAGLYLVSFSGIFTPGNDYVYTNAVIRLNSATDIAATSDGGLNGGYQPQLTVSTLYKFTAGQWVDMLVRQDNNANAARNLLANGNSSPEFSAVWVGLG